MTLTAVDAEGGDAQPRRLGQVARKFALTDREVLGVPPRAAVDSLETGRLEAIDDLLAEAKSQFGLRRATRQAQDPPPAPPVDVDANEVAGAGKVEVLTADPAVLPEEYGPVRG